MDDHYVLAICSRPERFLLSQILYRLYKSPSDETINRCPPCVYMHAKRSHTQVNDPVVHVRVRWITETPKQPSMHEKVSESSECQRGTYTEEEEDIGLTSSELDRSFDAMRVVQELRYQTCHFVCGQRFLW